VDVMKKTLIKIAKIIIGILIFIVAFKVLNYVVTFVLAGVVVLYIVGRTKYLK